MNKKPITIRLSQGTMKMLEELATNEKQTKTFIIELAIYLLYKKSAG